MTQEEKAKAYDEALALMKDCIPDKDGYVCVRPCDIFQELKESEDERIANAIKKHLDMEKSERNLTGYFGVSYQEAVTWLEKQGENKHLELKAGKWYICYRAYCCRADHLTVKEGERILCEKDGVVKGFVIKDAEKYFKECNAPAPYEDEQKPKWTEEDSLMIDSIIDTIKWLKSKGATDMKIEWLESLKQRMEQ